MQDQVDSFAIENENLKQRLRDNKKIDSLEEKLNVADRRSVDALKLGNHNKQYSRSNNIRMLNFPERKNEKLREDFVKLVNTELGIVYILVSEDIFSLMKNTEMIPGCKTDHSAITFTFLPVFPGGKGVLEV